MYLPVSVKGRKISALVDTGAACSFVSKKLSNQFRLRLSADISKV